MRVLFAILVPWTASFAALTSVAARPVPQAEELLQAAEFNQVERVRALLKRGVPVDVRDSFGNTPLMKIARGTRLAMRDVCRTEACRKFRERFRAETARVTRLLIKAGADVHAVNKEGETALNVAASACMPVTTRILVAARSNINSRDLQGFSPLMSAASAPGRVFGRPDQVKKHRERCYRVVEYLMARRPVLTFKNLKGKDVHDIVRELGDKKMMELVTPGLKCRATLFMPDKEGDSPRVRLSLRNTGPRFARIKRRADPASPHDVLALELTRDGRAVRPRPFKPVSPRNDVWRLRSGYVLGFSPLYLKKYFNLSERGSYRLKLRFRLRTAQAAPNPVFRDQDVHCPALHFKVPLETRRDVFWRRLLKKDARMRKLDARLKRYIAEARERKIISKQARVRLRAEEEEGGKISLRLEFAKMRADEVEQFARDCMKDSRCRLRDVLRFHVLRSVLADAGARGRFTRILAAAPGAGRVHSLLGEYKDAYVYEIKRPGTLSDIELARRKSLLERVHAFMSKRKVRLEISRVAADREKPALKVRIILKDYEELIDLVSALRTGKAGFQMTPGIMRVSDGLILQAEIKEGEKARDSGESPDLSGAFARNVLVPLLEDGAPAAERIRFRPGKRVSLSFDKVPEEKLRAYLDRLVSPGNRMLLEGIFMGRPGPNATKVSASFRLRGGPYAKGAPWRTLRPLTFFSGSRGGVRYQLTRLSYYSDVFSGSRLTIRLVVEKEKAAALKKAFNAWSALVRPSYLERSLPDGKLVNMTIRGLLKVK